MKNSYDVVVIGGGHAGVEAGLAAARMGRQTLMVTMDANKIGWMPCNPSIGGPAKGQIVAEIDALGGEMGRAADATQLQVKVLNRSRGPAVQCLRSQNDKYAYSRHMCRAVADQANLDLREDAVHSLHFEGKSVCGLRTERGDDIFAKTIVITTGTFLKAKMYTGMTATTGGRLNEASSETLSDSLVKRLRLGRLKTGTPPRLDHQSIDYSKMTVQPGDPEFLHFSFRTKPDDRHLQQTDCYLTHTTKASHDIILNSLDRSPMYQKVIKGTGPRYCPSIEDKVVRFAEKDSHHIFIEPESATCNQIYPQGLNTSLPADAQEAFLKTMPGLENVSILKYGYAVEYDFVYPDQLAPSLEVRDIPNLFLAGQINGTSGYEEAAGQGIVAGINAALKAGDQPPFILTRESSFIGTMIDDLITKNIYEPYRMLTSRSEYRLLLRQDNAHFRLGEYGHRLGLLSQSDIGIIRQQRADMDALKKRWQKTPTPDAFVSLFGLKHKIRLSAFLKRPDATIQTLLASGLLDSHEIEIAQRAAVELKYAGYISKQELEIARLQAYERKKIPEDLDFDALVGLRNESREKFKTYRPKTVYDARRIAGINPADIMVLVAYFEKYRPS